jgi:hypothetical protein
MFGAFFDQLRQITLPKGKAGKPGGVSVTTTYNPSNPKLSAPQYREHLEDIYQSRLAGDSRTVVKGLLRSDPDFSSTKDAYLTLGDTEPSMTVFNAQGEVDETGQEQLEAVLDALFVPSDYTLGFRPVQTFRSMSERMRYMFLMRGMCIAELVLDKQKLPYEVRLADPSTIEFQEPSPGLIKMIQVGNGGVRIPLDSPTIFMHTFHQDPTDVYPTPHFVSAINTVAARQAVINALFQIMKTTGAPRLTVKIVEEVARKNMPAEISSDPVKMKAYFTDIMNSISAQITTLRPDQAFVHFDSVEPSFLDQKGVRTGMEQRVKEVMGTLDNQNQAGLKTMGTVIGRGESGVNTGSVEARMFALNTDGLNKPVAEIWSQLLTLALRLTGYDGQVLVKFTPVELRPNMELEPQRLIMQQRLLQDLSLGLISDIEYHQMMYNRLPPAGTPPLSGTGFMAPAQDAQSPSPNSDPLGRSVSGGAGASRAAKSKSVKKPVKAHNLALQLIESGEEDEDDESR